jgi:hydrogenase maturation protease
MDALVKKKNVLILGIGNILQMDDGVGPHIITELLESGNDFPGNVEMLDGGTAGYDLVLFMQNRDRVIVIDALRVDDKPGSIYRFTADNIAPEKPTYSLHDFGLKKILDMLKMSGHEPHVEIIGIVPEDITTLDIGLSQSVKDAIPKVYE